MRYPFGCRIMPVECLCSMRCEKVTLVCELCFCSEEVAMSREKEGAGASRIPFIKDASENLPEDASSVAVESGTSEEATAKKKHVFTRRDVLAMCGCGVV